MGTEIERKFRVVNSGWRSDATSETHLRQGFLSTEPERTVRVRSMDGTALLTIKGITRGARRTEYEYSIPPADAEEILDHLCQPGLVEKTRYRVPHGSHVWEIDVFHGDNSGLVVAEVELGTEDEAIDLPTWIGTEVTGDPKYYNANLARQPYREWRD